MVGVVIPLRSFIGASTRLAGALDDDARAALARSMADRVADVVTGMHVVVVTSAPEVIEWAAERAFATIDDPGSLDGAADAGRAWVRAQQLARVVVMHADLPFVTSIETVLSDDPNLAIVVPDHRDDGTPVLSLPIAAPFRFAYGGGSAARHIDEARHCGLAVRIVHDRGLGFDVDVEEDLRALARNDQR